MAKMNADDWKGYPNIPETKADPKDAEIKQLQSENAALRKAVGELRDAAKTILDEGDEQGKIWIDDPGYEMTYKALAAAAQWESE